MGSSDDQGTVQEAYNLKDGIRQTQNMKSPLSVPSLHSPLSPSLILIPTWLAYFPLFSFPNHAAHLFQITLSKTLLSLCSQTQNGSLSCTLSEIQVLKFSLVFKPLPSRSVVTNVYLSLKFPTLNPSPQ